jgi:protein-S-isoprenylcysteine O-methyltransferase Ste14
MAISSVRLILIVAGTAAYLGVAVLGWGGFSAFFSHRALVALAIALFALSGVALFAGGNLSPGVREDRGNRWVLVAFALIGLLGAYLPAYTDRNDFWTFDGEGIRWLGVALFAAGGALRIWPVFVLGRRFSGLVAIQPWHTLVTTGVYSSSATPVIWACSLTRWGGALPFVLASACCSRRSVFRRSLRASALRRCYCVRSSAPITMLTGPVGHG